MSFSWTSITQNVTNVQEDHANEVRTNINTMLSLIGKPWTWVTLPVSAGDKTNYSQFKEMRDAADHAKDWNYCWQQDSSLNTAIDDAKDHGIDAAQNTSMLSGQDATVQNPHDHSVNATQYTGLHTGDDATVY